MIRTRLLMGRKEKRKRHKLWTDTQGSFTVEALFILPAVLILIALFLRWASLLREDLDQEAGWEEGMSFQDYGTATDPLAEIGFFHGGPPARRIRDADLIIDLGYSIKEKLPGWIQKTGGG